MLVLSGSDEASYEFAKSLASSLDVSHVKITEKVFPDGETYIRIPEEALKSNDVIFVQTFAPPQDTAIIKTLLVVDTLRDKGISRIRLIVPYLAYARQDKEFLPNEAISIRTILKALRYMGVSELYTIEVHKEESLKFFEGNAYNISPYYYMAKKISVPENTVVLAPDVGALKRAKIFAEVLKTDYDYLIKERDRVTGEIRHKPKSLNVKGSNVIIVDDVISTGGTVAKAAQFLRSQGAKEVYVIVAHALMVNGALDKLKKAGIRKVYACNTLPKINDPIVEYIDVGPYVAEEIKKWL